MKPHTLHELVEHQRNRAFRRLLLAMLAFAVSVASLAFAVLDAWHS